MLFAEARRQARRDLAGDYVPLADQDTSLWDAALIGEAEALLRKASALEGVGRYQFEAAVQSAHVAGRLNGRTDWAAIALLYEALAALSGSPVVAINRAVAIAESKGVDAGLRELEWLADDARLRDYQPYWAARADLLARSGEPALADEAYRRTIGLERDEAVRRFLERRRLRLHRKD